MTLLLLEGFDWLETADLPAAYGAFASLSSLNTYVETIEEAGGRAGGKSYKLSITGGNTFQGISFPVNVAAGTEVIFGFAVKFGEATVDDDFTYFLTLGNIFDNLRFYRLQSGLLCPTRGGAFFELATNVNLVKDVWHYIECKFVSDNSTGSIEIRVNGIIVKVATNIDTSVTSDENANLTLGTDRRSGTTSIEFDDLYICDSLGSDNNDYLGDINVEMIKPDGNGNTSNFTGSDANSVDNYLHVDDGAAPDDDSSYVEDSVAANKDLYTYTALPSDTNVVKGLGVKTLARHTNAGGPQLKSVVRSNVTESDSGDLAFGLDYIARQKIYEQDPNTSSAWTESGVNAMEAGVKVS